MSNALTLNLEREFGVPARELFEAIGSGLLFLSCDFEEGPTKLDFRVGGKYDFLWDKGPGVHGEFLEIVPNKKVVFTWSEMNTKVTILIEDKGASSILKLTHELVPDAYWHDRFKGGWTYGFNALSKTLNES